MVGTVYGHALSGSMLKVRNFGRAGEDEAGHE